MIKVLSRSIIALFFLSCFCGPAHADSVEQWSTVPINTLCPGLEEKVDLDVQLPFNLENYVCLKAGEVNEAYNHPVMAMNAPNLCFWISKELNKKFEEAKKSKDSTEAFKEVVKESDEVYFTIGETILLSQINDTEFDHEIFLNMPHNEPFKSALWCVQHCQKYKLKDFPFIYRHAKNGYNYTEYQDEFEAYIGLNCGGKTLNLEVLSGAKEADELAELWTEIIKKNSMVQIENKYDVSDATR